VKIREQKVIKSRRIEMGWSCGTDGEMRNAYKILDGKPKVKSLVGRRRH